MRSPRVHTDLKAERQVAPRPARGAPELCRQNSMSYCLTASDRSYLRRTSKSVQAFVGSPPCYLGWPCAPRHQHARIWAGERRDICFPGRRSHDHRGARGGPHLYALTAVGLPHLYALTSVRQESQSGPVATGSMRDRAPAPYLWCRSAFRGASSRPLFYEGIVRRSWTGTGSSPTAFILARMLSGNEPGLSLGRVGAR